MTTPVEKRNASKFCEFYRGVGHTTDECMHLKRQIEEMLKTGKLSHLIKELKQNNGKDQEKVAKKGEAAGKDKPLAILMVQMGQKIAKQRITQTFSPKTMISFPPLWEEDVTEGPMVIEDEVGGHLVHRMYVDGSASSKILRRGTLNFRMDELHGCKIAFSVQRNNRKVKCKENQNNRVHNPRNVEISSDRRNGHTAERKDLSSNSIAIGSTLTEEGRKKLCGLLRQNLDIFAWKPADMTGVPRHIAEHRLNIREGCFPVRQKKRGQATKRNKAICEEVEKLVNADFKDSNKACPKDGYPLPEID
ncbi:hypothetical protein Tco_1159714 [Tanacetum coccineum]